MFSIRGKGDPTFVSGYSCIEDFYRDLHLLSFFEFVFWAQVNLITSRGGKAQAVQCDISNDAQQEQLFRTVGVLDIVVLNAGIFEQGREERSLLGRPQSTDCSTTKSCIAGVHGAFLRALQATYFPQQPRTGRRCWT
jgi:NAD(P)-dependent dehydrogenase (short-subunit alcohol dehydrogenase family)